MPRGLTLLELVERPEAFVPSRHHRLLATDSSLLRLELDDEHPQFERLCRLADLQIAYREALDDHSRRAIALAFKDAANGRWERYLAITRGWKWATDSEGRWIRVACDCADCFESPV